MTYEVIQELINFRDVVAAFPDGIADNEHWLIVGTGGWHGSYTTLDDCELILRDAHPTWKKDGAYITVLVINPKDVTIKWGQVHLKNLSEVSWCRQQVKATLDIIQITQEGSK